MAALALAVSLVSGGASAQDPPPDGIPAGPWILAPLAVAGLAYESNVLYEPRSGSPISDELGRGRVALAAYLPFRVSLLQLAAQRDWRDYRDTELVGSNTADEFRVDLGMKLSTGDRIRVNGDLTYGIADTSVFDPGGEAVFRGEPFRYREAGVQVERSQPGRRGYDARWVWRSLAFDREDQNTGFYDYDGWAGSVVYREPLSASAWATASYDARRFDHFCVGIDVDGTPCPGLESPFRKESADFVFAGVEGRLAGDRPYKLEAGWGVLRFDGGLASDFRGPVAQGTIRLRTAASSRLELSMTRRPWASFYTGNNYYLSTYGDVRYEVVIPTGLEAGVTVGFIHSSYPEAVPLVLDGDPVRRVDDTLRAEAYANLQFRRRFGIRGSVLYQDRTSTDSNAEYNAQTFFLGMFYGWY